MKQIIPFTKDIPLKTKINEITSISLEHDLSFKNDQLLGNFYIKGKYKMTEASQIENDYSYKVPFEVTISDRYSLDNAFSDIEDFYYEIIDEEVLRINIEIYIDGLEEKEEIFEEEHLTEKILNDNREEIAKLISLDEEVIKNHINKEERVDSSEENIVKVEDVITNINSNNDDTYLTYSVYIFRDTDTLEEIIEKYHVTKEDLLKYNDLEDLKTGSKLVIPSNKTNE